MYPDPYQNVTDPEHCFLCSCIEWFISFTEFLCLRWLFPVIVLTGGGSGSTSLAVTASPAGKRKNIAEAVAGSTPGTSAKRIRTPTAKMLEAIGSETLPLLQGAATKRGKVTTPATVSGAAAVTPSARVNNVETGLEVWQTEEFRTTQVKLTGALL